MLSSSFHLDKWSQLPINKRLSYGSMFQTYIKFNITIFLKKKFIITKLIMSLGRGCFFYQALLFTNLSMNNLFCLGLTCLLNTIKTKAQTWRLFRNKETLTHFYLV